MRSSVMRRLSNSLWIAVIAAGLPSARAGIIYVNSDLTNESNNITGVDNGIPVSPVWQSSGTGYEWISYSGTGCNTFVALTGTCTSGPENPAAPVGDITLGSGSPVAPTAIFYKDFTLPYNTNTGYISVWADDTARVYLDTPGGQILLIDANPVLGGHCADAPVGCVPGMEATFDISGLNLTSGDYTLEIQAYQLKGGTPFGVMYNGQIDSEAALVGESASVPEPATFALLGLGLAALGSLGRRTRKRE